MILKNIFLLLYCMENSKILADNFDYRYIKHIIFDPKQLNYVDFDWDAFWYNLSLNENAVKILEKYPEKIKWINVSQNKNAIDFLKRNPEKINWTQLTTNENASELLTDYFEQNFNKIRWDYLGLNKSKFAMDYIETHFNTIKRRFKNHSTWKLLKEHLSQNDSVYAVDFLKKHPEMIDWREIAANKNAMEIIEPNLNKIYWANLSKNENAIHILKENRDEIYWDYLSANKNAMDLLVENVEKIEWEYFSSNENVFPILKKLKYYGHYLSKINYLTLSANQHAFDFLMEHPYVVDWMNFAENKHEYAMLVLEKAIPMLMELVKDEEDEDEYSPMSSYEPSFSPTPPSSTQSSEVDFDQDDYDTLPGSSVQIEETSFDSNDNKTHHRLRHMRGNDLIYMNESFVSKHILTNSNNIVLVLNKDVILTRKKDIKKHVLIRKNFVYECVFHKVINKQRILKVDENMVYCKLGNFGFPVNYSYINAKYIEKILKGKHQIYEFKETKKELESVKSMYRQHPNEDEIDDPELGYGSSHCQEGQGGKVFVMKKIRNDHHKNETLKELKQATKKNMKNVFDELKLKHHTIHSSHKKSKKKRKNKKTKKQAPP